MFTKLHIIEEGDEVALCGKRIKKDRQRGKLPRICVRCHDELMNESNNLLRECREMAQRLSGIQKLADPTVEYNKGGVISNAQRK